jgi:glycosyltransferase involved in cell wall biosynthesis
MRIGYDFRPTLKKNSRRRGIGKYTYQLIRQVLAGGSDHEFLLYGMSGHLADVPGSCRTANLPYLPKPSRLNWIPDLVALPARLRWDGIDIFHATEITSIPKSGKTQVWAHVHDMIPFLFWEETRPGLAPDYAWALKRTRKRMVQADLIITDSLCSRRDICRLLQVPEEKVQVVLLGCDEIFRPRDRAECLARLQQQYDLPAPFVFYVGGTDFRKNLPRLVSAFARIRRAGYPGRLVLAGETFAWDIAEVRLLKSECRRLGLEDFVQFAGYIPDEDLPDFYCGCDAFLFPSLYEGFGLPVLEAMKCGAPLLVSQNSSIPEVAGDAAVYIDPESEESIASGFLSLHQDPCLQNRLRQEGFRRAPLFTWQAAARQILSLYESHGR